jgi:glycosyltransferase involved in cell wall biosynthesis
MIPVVGIPIVNRLDLLIRCLKSVDHDVGRVVIVNNGQIPSIGSDLLAHAICRPNSFIKSIEVYEPKANIGCAGAWNYLLREHARVKGSVMLVNNDIEFSPGDLSKMESAMFSDPEMCAVFSNHSFSNFIVTRKGIERFGYFDENFYPAYFEDGDYWRRITLSGATICHPETNSVHGEPPHWGSATIKSDPELAKQNDVTFVRNRELYRRKWGWRDNPAEGERHEIYIHPFADSKLGPNDWAISTERQSQPHYLDSAAGGWIWPATGQLERAL